MTNILTKSLGVALFFVCSLSFSQSDKQVSQFNLASRLINSGKVDEGITILKKLRVLQPWNFSYINSLNNAYIKLKDYESSISLLLKETSNQNNITLYGLLGSTYYMMGNQNEAYNIWDKGLELNKSSAVNYRIISSYMIQNRSFDKAIETLVKGKNTTNNYSMFSLELARLYSVTMNFKNAAREYCELLIKTPTQLNTIKSTMTRYLKSDHALTETIHEVKNISGENNSLGIKELLLFLYFQNSNYKEALILSKQIDSLINNNGAEIYTFAYKALNEGHYKLASEAFEFIIKEYSNSNYYTSSELGYAKALEFLVEKESQNWVEKWKPIVIPNKKTTDRYLKVISQYKKLVGKYSNSIVQFESLLRIANIQLYKTNELISAEKTINLILSKSKSPKFLIDANLLKISLQIKKGELGLALKSCSNVLSIKNIPNIKIKKTQFLKAKIEFFKSDFQKAIKSAEKVTTDLSSIYSNDALNLKFILESFSSDSIGLSMLAETELSIFRNDFDSAVLILNEIISKSKNIFLKEFVKLRLAQILVAINKYMESVELLKQMIDNDPNGIYNEKGLFLLGNIYQNGLQRYDEALKIFENILENYPNSLYLDEARENIFKIKSQEIKNL